MSPTLALILFSRKCWQGHLGFLKFGRKKLQNILLGKQFQFKNLFLALTFLLRMAQVVDIPGGTAIPNSSTMGKLFWS